jgi:hypothetical protein
MTSPGQRQVLAQRTRAAAQEVATAHIGEQANIGLGHGHARALGHDAAAASLADAHAAPHDYAVHECHIGLGVGEHQVVEGVFLGEKIFQRGVAGQGRLMEKADVAASAEGAEVPLFVATPNGHCVHRGVVFPGQQRRGERPDHGQAQGIEGTGAPQGDEAYTVCGLGAFHLEAGVQAGRTGDVSAHGSGSWFQGLAAGPRRPASVSCNGQHAPASPAIRWPSGRP